MKLPGMKSDINQTPQQPKREDGYIEPTQQESQYPTQNVPDGHAVDLAQSAMPAPEQPAEQQEQKPKRKLTISKATIFIIVSLVIIVLAGTLAYSLTGNDVNSVIDKIMSQFVNRQEEPPPEEPPEELPPPPPEEPNTDGMKEYLDVENEFLLTYPGEAKLVLPSVDDSLKVYKVIYSGERQSKPVETEEDLEDGYIVRISVFRDVLNRDLEKTGVQKRNTFIIKCPDTANFSDIKKGEIAGAEARIFEVTNCSTNVIQSFLIKGNNLFEISQIYKGDLGYEQVYRNATQEIVDMFKFTNIISPTPKETWEVRKTGFGFSFKFPKEMDSVCCTLEGPISSDSRKIMVLADPDSVLDVKGTTFNGFGVFYDENPGDLDFATYLESQKDLLEENYKVIVGRVPEGKEDKISVGGQEATLLRGYAWWGDIIYLPVPGRDGFIGIVKTELNEGEIDSVFEDFLSTFEFTDILVN